jgi:hypothetical protein
MVLRYLVIRGTFILIVQPNHIKRINNSFSSKQVILSLPTIQLKTNKDSCDN